MPTKAMNRQLVFMDSETHARLKRLVAEYDCTIIELMRELVESEYRKKFGDVEMPSASKRK